MSKSHADCSTRRCFANDTRGGHASVCHLEISCLCNSIGPQMLDIARIVDANMIPVVAVEGSDIDPSIVVEAYQPGLAFTIISHA